MLYGKRKRLEIRECFKCTRGRTCLPKTEEKLLWPSGQRPEGCSQKPRNSDSLQELEEAAASSQRADLLTSGLCPSNIDSILLASRVQENYLLVFVVTTFVIIYYTAAQEANARGLWCLKFIIVDLVQCWACGKQVFRVCELLRMQSQEPMFSKIRWQCWCKASNVASHSFYQVWKWQREKLWELISDYDLQ